MALQLKVRIERMSVRNRLIAITIVWATFAIGTVYLHSTFADAYYRIEGARLGTIAKIAASAGVRLLPIDPNAAKEAALASAENNGIAAHDILSVAVSPDHLSLTIELAQKVPIGFALLKWTDREYLRVSARAVLSVKAPHTTSGLETSSSKTFAAANT